MISFSQLYDKQADFVYTLCTRFEHNLEFAEILCGDTWRLIQKRIPQLQGESELKWLSACVVESHRLFRQKGQHSRVSLSPSPSPEEILLYALNQLSLAQLWPLALREFVGFNYKDLADICKIPEATVRARISAGRIEIRRIVEEQAL